MEKNKTATEILDEVREAMCNDYCKFTEKARALLELDAFLEACYSCPLNRL